MKKKIESGKTYIGTVEDIKDPDKNGRVKVRVLDIHSDDQELESIPWATPWKDLGGGQFSLPEIGKVVVVVFDQGDVNKPEYIYTEHWNVNLENKLKSLGDSDYGSMKSVIFDHKTQIYSNDSEGLKVDYKFNNINIKEDSINLNLKDNNSILNIGDSAANQQMVLGTNFMNWMDQFLECFLSNTALIGNAGAPVLMTPKLADIISKYQSQKTTHLLSQHVNIVDNNQVVTVKSSNREETAQAGDTWKSTVKENTLTTVSEETSKPEEGTKPQYSEKFTEPPVSTPGASASEAAPNKKVDPLPEKSSPQSNPTVEKLIWFLKDKGYDWYEKPHELNIVAFRSAEKFQKQTGGNEVRVPVPPTNKFDDEVHIFYKTEAGAWEHLMCSITTVPGFVPNQSVLPKDVAILRLGQYKEQLRMSNFLGDEKHKCLTFDKCAIHRNSKLDVYDYESPSEIGNFPLSIHKTNVAQAEFVFNYSEGSQVFKNSNQYDIFINLCQKQIDIAKKETFTYTLAFKSEYEKYPAPAEQREELKLKLLKPSKIEVPQKEIIQKSDAEKKLEKLENDVNESADKQISGLSKLIQNYMLSDRQIAKKIILKKSPEFSDRDANLVSYGKDLEKEIGPSYKPFVSDNENTNPDILNEDKKSKFKPLSKDSPIFDEVKKIKTEVKDGIFLLQEKAKDLGKEVAKFGILVGSTIPAAAIMVAPVSFNVPGALTLTTNLLNGIANLNTKLKEFTPLLRVVSKLGYVLPENKVDEVLSTLNPILTSITTVSNTISSIKLPGLGSPEDADKRLEQLDKDKEGTAAFRLEDIKDKISNLKLADYVSYPNPTAAFESAKNELEAQKEILSENVKRILEGKEPLPVPSPPETSSSNVNVTSSSQSSTNVNSVSIDLSPFGESGQLGEVRMGPNGAPYTWSEIDNGKFGWII